MSVRSGSICRTDLKPAAFDAVDGLADRYRFGDSARAIAQARVLAKADADAAHLTRVAA